MTVTDLDIAHAAERLADGGLVAFPTETVYGLGGDANDDAAVAAIFRAKGRPADHPLIVHVALDADLAFWTASLPELARALIERFWPGPLTLILPRAIGVARAAAGGQDSIGLRCPAHPVARRLLAALASCLAERRCRDASRALGVGIAAPSANRYGHVSPTTAAHVRDEFPEHDAQDLRERITLLDGGPCPLGIESTILDCSRLATLGPVLLRPGSITATMIAEVSGSLPLDGDAAAPRASGTLAAHYAPATPLTIVDAEALSDAPDDVAVWTHSKAIPPHRALWLAAPRDAAHYAHDLYAVLRSLDISGARAIWIERPPCEFDSPDWAGINDRLRRAATGSGRVQR